jgi:hypothetical protein
MNYQFQREKAQIEKLNSSREIVSVLRREFGERDFSRYISKPQNFQETVFFHNANSRRDAHAIVKFGFKDQFVTPNNSGLERGLYVGRDKEALVSFYTENQNYPEDNTIKVIGQPKFVDLIGEKDFNKFLRTAKKARKSLRDYTVQLGFDGIRYYDLYATGEEFVIYRYRSLRFELGFSE